MYISIGAYILNKHIGSNWFSNPSDGGFHAEFLLLLTYVSV